VGQAECGDSSRASLGDARLPGRFDKATCRWSVLGAAAEVFRSAERGRVIAALEEAGEALSVTEIMAAADIKSRGAADMLLGRMVRDGVLRKSGRGRYELDALDREKDTQPAEEQDEIDASNDLTHLTQGASNGSGATTDDPGGIPKCLRRCNRCGALATPSSPLNPYDWPGWPDGIWLHRKCEEPWFESDRQLATADKSVSR